MPLEVLKAESRIERDLFIRFPFQIYQDDPVWVPPLIYERRKFLDTKINPFFKHAEMELFLAWSRRGEPVGRIALVVDHHYNEFHNERTGFFGLYESVNDPEVANLLFRNAMEWCRNRGLDRLLGPMNLSTNHECGLLVENFEDPPVMGMPYNPPYYAPLFEKCGLSKAKDLISFQINVVKIPEYLQRAIPLLRKRGHYTIRTLRLDKFSEEINIVWEIYNAAWQRNWGFVPMTREEFVFAAAEMKRIVNPAMCYIAEVNGEPAGFSLMLPDINQALKRLNGRLLPFGWLKFLLGKRKINRYRVITLGVKKQYQKLGIDAEFYYRMYSESLRLGIPIVDMSWVLEDNNAMTAPIERIGGVRYKKHRLYERACNI